MKAIATLALATVSVMALGGVALAADLVVPPAAPEPAPATNWDGPYIGANIGYSWGLADHTSGPGTNDINLTGYEAGGQIGYLFHLSDNIVGGVEASLDWSNEDGLLGTGGTVPAGSISHTINWEGMVLAKLGLDAGQFMPYIDGGFAAANSTRSTVPAAVSTNLTQYGWTVGIGVEAMLAEHVSAFVQYNYADYGSGAFPTGGITPTIHLTDNILKGGVNFHF